MRVESTKVRKVESIEFLKQYHGHGQSQPCGTLTREVVVMLELVMANTPPVNATAEEKKLTFVRLPLEPQDENQNVELLTNPPLYTPELNAFTVEPRVALKVSTRALPL